MEDKEDDELRPSWSPVDLSNVLNGTVQLEIPGLLHREDGTGLFYPGRIHWLYGETESGKSWVAQATAAQVLIAGGQVLYVDHESDVASVVGRLLLLGADKSAMLERFHYVQPETSAAREYAAFASLLDNEYAFATIDGVTDALGLETAKTVDTDEVAGWMRRVPRLIARKTGAAVVCIDHVTKSNDGRGRFPIGSQAKLAGIDGVAYLAEPTMPLGVGKRGEIELRIAKDRPGVLRPQSGEWRKSDRTQLAGTFVLDSTTSPTTVTVLRPDMAPAAPFKPTMLMERVSMLLEGESGLSARKIREQVQGNNNAIVLALDHLVTEGFVRRDTVTNGFVHSSVRPYRQNEQGGTSGSPYREGGPPVPPTQPDPGVDQVPPQVPPGTAGQGRYHPSTAVDSRGGLGRGTTPGTTPSQQDHCRACRVPYTAPNGMPFCPSCGAMPDEEGAA